MLKIYAEGNVMEAVRAYLRELRIGRQISQDDLADAVGLSRQALIDWEMGRTKDIKSGSLLRAIEHLRGALTDIGTLIDASIETGLALARQRLAEPAISEQHRQQIEAIANAIPDEDVDEVIALLEDLQRKHKTREWISFGRFLKTDT